MREVRLLGLVVVTVYLVFWAGGRNLTGASAYFESLG